MSTSTLLAQQRSHVITANRFVYRISRNWLLVFSLIFGIFVGIPFLAPLLIQIGWEGAAKVIYFAYSWLCHQMPQRSFFLFGQRGMYALDDIQAAWQVTTNPLILRQFIGNPSLGWKVAWSDRMVSLYTVHQYFVFLLVVVSAAQKDQAAAPLGLCPLDAADGCRRLDSLCG